MCQGTAARYTLSDGSGIYFGLPEETFTKMGFELLDLDGETIVPNYFEPFEQRNVKIEIAYKTKGDNYVAFKADSDQDRPNIL